MIKIKPELKNFVRPSPHAVYGPSSGDRWMACPYSVKASEGIPNETSKYAEEGTLAHEVCEHTFRERKYGIPFPLDVNLQLSQLPDNGDEMMDSAHQYCDLIEAWLDPDTHLGKILWFGMEKGVTIFGTECFGTADFLIVGEKGAAVIDFKYGKGKEVGKGSTQLKQYALGVYKCLENTPSDYEFNAVVFQPRITAIPKVDVYSCEELAIFNNEVSAAIDESKKDNLSPCEGNHCYWCPAKRTRDPNLKCPAIKQKVIDAANQNFNDFFTDMNLPANKDGNTPSELDVKRDKALIKILSLAPLIKKMAEDAEDELAYRLTQGEAIQGVLLRDVNGRRKWMLSDTDSMALEIIKKFPTVVNATETVTKLKSISKIEKIVGKGKLDTLTIKPITKKLIINDEKVQEVLQSFSAFNLTH